jgi:hypothetical protein
MVRRRTLAVFAALLLGSALVAPPADARSKRACRRLCRDQIADCVRAFTRCGVLPTTDTLPRTLEVACTREITRRCSEVTTRGGMCFSPSGAFLDPDLD